VTNDPSCAAVPDEELVERARRGERGALDELVERHHAVVYRVVLRIVGDPDLAADASQDTFLKAFRALDGFRGDARFRTWIVSIAANEARGVLRRAGRRRERPLDTVSEPASTAVDHATRVAVTDEVEHVLRLLATLPEKQRMAVQLRTQEGLSFREVGEVIGSSEGAARVNYFHGIRRLRELLEESG